MKRLFPIIMVLLVVVLSGCTGRDATSETKGQIFERANLNLNGKMMDLQLLPNDARAGEQITANLVVGNTGSENINSETIDINAKAKSLDDFLANIAVMLMSNEKKTITFSKDYTEEIKTGMIKPFTYVFPSPKELKGKSLSGIYEVTITLSVNGQKVESKSMDLKLRSGKSRDASNTTMSTPSSTVSVTSTPTVTVAATPATTVTAATSTPTPSPTPAQQEVTVDTLIFGWDDVPGKDSARLTGFLKQKYAIDWVESAKIEKIDAGVINFTSENHYLSLQLDEYKTKSSLILDDGRTSEFLGMIVNGKLQIYSGTLRFTRIKGWTFSEPNIDLDAGNWMQWQNLWDDEFEYTLKEVNGKMPNITVRNRRDVLFNTTGTYKFELYYPKMRVSPPTQTIKVKLNQSQ